MTQEADDYRHPKCYANTRGGCSTKISGEHYVSHGLIKLYGNNDPDFTVQHKTGKGVGHPVTPKNFKANILCQKHNSALSPADGPRWSSQRSCPAMLFSTMPGPVSGVTPRKSLSLVTICSGGC